MHIYLTEAYKRRCYIYAYPTLSDSVLKVYKRRWYILVMYSLVAATQGGVWNTFGPIASTAEDAFGWSDATIALLSNWGPIAYLVDGIAMSWMLDVKGERFLKLF